MPNINEQAILDGLKRMSEEDPYGFSYEILKLLEYKDEVIDNHRQINQQLFDEMRERMDEETRIAMRMGYNKAINEIISECNKIKRTDYPVTNSVHMEDLKAITDVLKAKSKDIKFPKVIIADEIFRKFAGHSDYHGDTILSIINCMAEGKVVNTPQPLDTDELKLKAIKWAFEKIREKINRFHYLGMFGPTGGKVKYAMCVEDCDLNEIEKYFEGVYGKTTIETD